MRAIIRRAFAEDGLCGEIHAEKQEQSCHSLSAVPSSTLSAASQAIVDDVDESFSNILDCLELF